MTNITEQNYKQSIANGLCVVTFGAPWCRDCVALKPILAQLEPEFEGKINFFGVDFDTAVNLKDELNIRRIPTVIFYKNGAEVLTRLVEPNSLDAVRKAFNELLEA